MKRTRLSRQPHFMNLFAKVIIIFRYSRSGRWGFRCMVTKERIIPNPPCVLFFCGGRICRDNGEGAGEAQRVQNRRWARLKLNFSIPKNRILQTYFIILHMLIASTEKAVVFKVHDFRFFDRGGTPMKRKKMPDIHQNVDFQHLHSS